jgi:hypothetical protein
VLSNLLQARADCQTISSGQGRTSLLRGVAARRRRLSCVRGAWRPVGPGWNRGAPRQHRHHHPPGAKDRPFRLGRGNSAAGTGRCSRRLLRRCCLRHRKAAGGRRSVTGSIDGSKINADASKHSVGCAERLSDSPPRPRSRQHSARRRAEHSRRGCRPGKCTGGHRLFQPNSGPFCGRFLS